MGIAICPKCQARRATTPEIERAPIACRRCGHKWLMNDPLEEPFVPAEPSPFPVIPRPPVAAPVIPFDEPTAVFPDEDIPDAEIQAVALPSARSLDEEIPDAEFVPVVSAPVSAAVILHQPESPPPPAIVDAEFADAEFATTTVMHDPTLMIEKPASNRVLIGVIACIVVALVIFGLSQIFGGKDEAPRNAAVPPAAVNSNPVPRPAPVPPRETETPRRSEPRPDPKPVPLTEQQKLLNDLKSADAAIVNKAAEMLAVHGESDHTVRLEMQKAYATAPETARPVLIASLRTLNEKVQPDPNDETFFLRLLSSPTPGAKDYALWTFSTSLSATLPAVQNQLIKELSASDDKTIILALKGLRKAHESVQERDRVPTLKKLAELLNHDESEIVTQALILMQKFEIALPEDSEILKTMLKHKQGNVCKIAAMKLKGTTQNFSSARELWEVVLKGKHTDVREIAIEDLGNFPAECQAPKSCIWSILYDAKEVMTIRQAALRALTKGRINTVTCRQITALIVTDEAMRADAVARLAGPDIDLAGVELRELAPLLKRAEPELQNQAARAIDKFHNLDLADGQDLLALFPSPHLEMNQLLIKKIAKKKVAGAAEPLAAFIRNDKNSPVLRNEAVTVLASFGDDGRKQLHALLRDEKLDDAILNPILEQHTAIIKSDKIKRDKLVEEFNKPERERLFNLLGNSVCSGSAEVLLAEMSDAKTIRRLGEFILVEDKNDAKCVMKPDDVRNAALRAIAQIELSRYYEKECNGLFPWIYDSTENLTRNQATSIWKKNYEATFRQANATYIVLDNIKKNNKALQR